MSRASREKRELLNSFDGQIVTLGIGINFIVTRTGRVTASGAGGRGGGSEYVTAPLLTGSMVGMSSGSNLTDMSREALDRVFSAASPGVPTLARFPPLQVNPAQPSGE